MKADNNFETAPLQIYSYAFPINQFCRRSDRRIIFLGALNYFGCSIVEYYYLDEEGKTTS